MCLAQIDDLNRGLTILRLHGPLASILFLLAALLSFVVGAPLASVNLSIAATGFIIIIWAYDKALSKTMLAVVEALFQAEKKLKRRTAKAEVGFAEFPRMQLHFMALLYCVIALSGTAVMGTFIVLSFGFFIHLYYMGAAIFWIVVLAWLFRSIPMYKKAGDYSSRYK